MCVVCVCVWLSACVSGCVCVCVCVSTCLSLGNIVWPTLRLTGWCIHEIVWLMARTTFAHTAPSPASDPPASSPAATGTAAPCILLLILDRRRICLRADKHDRTAPLFSHWKKRREALYLMKAVNVEYWFSLLVFHHTSTQWYVKFVKSLVCKIILFFFQVHSLPISASKCCACITGCVWTRTRMWTRPGTEGHAGRRGNDDDIGHKNFPALRVCLPFHHSRLSRAAWGVEINKHPGPPLSHPLASWPKQKCVVIKPNLIAFACAPNAPHSSAYNYAIIFDTFIAALKVINLI